MQRDSYSKTPTPGHDASGDDHQPRLRTPRGSGGSQSRPSPSDAPVFEPGAILDGTYRIVRRLATGGMGEVYLAAHERLRGHFAIKVLQPEFARRDEALSRFRREAEVMGGLHHPNVVRVFDFNLSPDGAPYLAMEFVDGPDLGAEMARAEPFVPAEVLSIIRQVASALDAAHAAGIVHRDLKPENVVLVPAPGLPPVVKVIDFGISLCDGSERITAESSVVGTPEFMAPEQALGLREQIDGRTDQFSLAALTYTLLCGSTPFKGENSLAILYAIVHGQPAPFAPQVVWPGTQVEQVLCKGMARDRSHRYDSVLEFSNALNVALSESGALVIAAPTALPTAPSASGSSESLRPQEIELRPEVTVNLRRPRGLMPCLVLLLLGGGFALAFVAEKPPINSGVTAAKNTIESTWRQLSSIVGHPSAVRDFPEQ